ncbi:helix-turn-helix domain-containing protein [Pseudomonas sp. B28(2017)]|uniref:helix-turn-helix domain-containing protein n=1 Tax=Pseudomonas sp. B28(2017) TaxID=1981730 RepID=UPI002113C85D|nr:helix-turn-helix domain-containing protein [Pseudomonas sp. B28(2017)]
MHLNASARTAACSFKALRHLLREIQLSVVTVANEVGYSNSSHFAHVFRKHTGPSPSDYRRQRQDSAGRR